MLEQIYTSAKTVAFSDINSARLCYLRSWDAMVCHDGGGYTPRVYKLFRDGSQATIISAPLSWIGLTGRVSGRHAWMRTNLDSVGAIWAADEISGNYHFDQRLNPNWTPPFEACRAGGFIDDINQIAIYPYVWSRLHFIDLSSGTEIAYLTLPGNYIYDHLAWAGEGKLIAIDFETGKLSLIDYLGRKIIWSSAVRPCKMAAYDCLHGVVITIESDLRVRVYIMETVPAVLSPPSFAVPMDQHRLMGTDVQTRLIGDAGEPCKDYWVHWSLLGLPPKGELLKDKSKTDADGYARNYYFGPRAMGETGAETIQVSVKVPS